MGDTMSTQILNREIDSTTTNFEGTQDLAEGRLPVGTRVSDVETFTDEDGDEMATFLASNGSGTSKERCFAADLAKALHSRDEVGFQLDALRKVLRAKGTK